jgi:ABC-type bacteriocin/lantibiotic exporter with double-glycine peptidase domain
MELAGTDIAFSELIRPEYVDSRVGSRLGQLKRAAEDFGLHATPVGNLTIRTLRESPYPVILHVKKSEESDRFDHFEVFLGAKNDKAILYDPPTAPRLESFHVLASRWDRIGLAVSKDEIDTRLLFLPDRKRSFLIGILLVSLIAAVWWMVPRRYQASSRCGHFLRKRIV